MRKSFHLWFFRYCLLTSLLGTPCLALATDIEKLAEDDWLLVKSENFQIVTDLDEEKGRHLVEDLEAYRFFSIELMKLNVLRGFNPLPILAISNNSNFKKLDLPEGWAGVFNLDSLGYAAIANVNNYRTSLKGQTFARQVLFHEYNHFLVRFTENPTYVPLWYNEGMAEYWGSFKYDGQKVYIGDPSAIEGRIYDLVNMGGSVILESEKLLNTTELPMTSKKTSDQSAIGRFYAQSFFLIHYFNSAPELRQSLDNYIHYLNGGYTEPQAFQKAFNMTYAELDKKAKAYLSKQLMMRVIGFKEGSVIFPKPDIAVTKLDKAGFYNQVSGILPLFNFFGKDTIKKLLEKNVALNPNDANAKGLLLTYRLADNNQQLEQELEAQAPQNALLLNYKGDNARFGADMLRRAGISGWEEAMKKARGFYRRAVKNDPRLALSYMGLGPVYDYLPTSEPLQEGIAGFETAALYKQEAQSFSDLADIYIRMDRGLEALPAVRNSVSFSKEKATSNYALVLENLELLQDASREKATLTQSGLSYASGSVYVGPVSSDKPQGVGKITRPNGSYYEGNFNQGVMQGQGKIYTYGGYVYEGEFDKGIARGKGKIIYPGNSGSYSGDVFYGMAYGHGLRTYKNRTYEGDYWYSFPQGKGTLVSADEKIKLTGRWIYGAFEWPEEDGIIFVGYVSDKGKREGKGICLRDAKAKMDWCEYKDGKLQSKTEELAAQAH